MLLVILVAASQTFYEAKVTTFGCNSIDELSVLQRIRADEKVFQKALYEQIFYGQCIVIEKGKLVEGSADAGEPSALLVDREILPPGYLAPLDDFDLRGDGGK